MLMPAIDVENFTCAYMFLDGVQSSVPCSVLTCPWNMVCAQTIQPALARDSTTGMLLLLAFAIREIES